MRRDIEFVDYREFRLRKSVSQINQRIKGRGVLRFEDVLRLFKRYAFRCCKCQSSQQLEIDHIIPLSKGGPNEIGNIQPLCIHCNATKAQKTIDYRYLGTEMPDIEEMIITTASCETFG